MLNRQSPIPLYHQLADIILSKIRSGRYPPGARIPSELKLAAAYQIGRPTVRQAIELLVRKRFLSRRRGSGTYVCEQRKEVALFSLEGTIASFHKEGLSVETVILEDLRETTVDQDMDNPFSGQRAYFFARLTKVETVPVLIENLYLDRALFPNIDHFPLEGRSLSETVEEYYYMRPYGGKQNFSIGYLDGASARLLGVEPSEPILIVKRFLHFPQAENAVFSELFCRTDQFVFSQHIGGSADG